MIKGIHDTVGRSFCPRRVELITPIIQAEQEAEEISYVPELLGPTVNVASAAKIAYIHAAEFTLLENGEAGRLKKPVV